MLGAIVGYVTNTEPNRSYSLTLDGLEVIASNGPNSYGVDVSSVQVVEAGPGQVSSMRFTITDPNGAVSITAGQRVLFWDLQLNQPGCPIFRGYVTDYSSTALGIGREIVVECDGVEAQLDWGYVPSMTFALGTDATTALIAVCSAAVGLSEPLRWATDATAANSTVDTPFGPGLSGITTGGTAITVGNGTLRDTLQAVAAACFQSTSLRTLEEVVFTVDYYLGLRCWRRYLDSSGVPQDTVDYLAITMDATTGSVRPSSTSYGVRMAGVVRQVYVQGSGAGTGLVGDGSGLPGPTAVISDANSTTAAYRDSVGQAYLRSVGQTQGGTVVAEGTVALGFTATTQKRAGSELQIIDPQVGLTGTGFRGWATEIAKEFTPGEETWTISYGKLDRGTQYIRQLTRTTLV